MKKLEPPTMLDPEYLFHKYEPLRKAIFGRFRPRMANHTDREELMLAINQTFIELVAEYDPNRGVDFPYYIKRMLELRIGHYATKYYKTVNSESYSSEDDENIEITVLDHSAEEILNRIVDLNSFDPNIVLGDKHRNLMIGLLIEHKTLKELADEEGVPLDRLHARLYFLLRKLSKVYESHVSKHGKDMY